MSFERGVSIAASLMEWAGITAMIAGAIVAFILTILRGVRRPESVDHFRRGLGRAILLGLEFLVAADIIRTVAEIPTLRSVAILAAIVLIRTFLSFTLEVELTGKWPWQKRND